MSVYNGEEFIRTAIESILNQTLKDFEFIIIDDGCTDKSPDIIESFKDSRIRLFRQTNQGLSTALNNGIAQARAEYIARMDADDISVNQRLELEYNFLKMNPIVGLVGTWISIIDSNGDVITEKDEPTSPEEIKRRMMTYNCFNHGSVMFRKSIFDQAHGYSTMYPESTPVEDYALWLRMLKFCDGANIPINLYLWRQHASSISSIQSQSQQDQKRLVSQMYIKSLIEALEKKENQRQELAYCHYSLGTIYYYQREMEESRKHLLRAIKLDPLVSAKIYRYLGLSFFSRALLEKMRRLRNIICRTNNG